MQKTDITYQRAKTNEELHQILALQQRNLPQHLSEKEKEAEGFVTVTHSFGLLKEMNNVCPHIIAKKLDAVVGYALCMTKDFKTKIPVLISMFNEIESVVPNAVNFMVMGQICIDKTARGQGVFRGLYQFMADDLKNDFNMIITEVDVTNTRSINAHNAVGFKLLKTYTSNNQTWKIIGLDL